MLRFCGILTLALNTSGALGHRQLGTALVDAVGPDAVCSPPVSVQPEPRAATGLTPVLPADLLARARELDAEHRAATGRPISRDTLRDQLRIGRDRAGAIVAVVRAEVPAEVKGGQLRAA